MIKLPKLILDALNTLKLKVYIWLCSWDKWNTQICYRLGFFFESSRTFHWVWLMLDIYMSNLSCCIMYILRDISGKKQQFLCQPGQYQVFSAHEMKYKICVRRDRKLKNFSQIFNFQFTFQWITCIQFNFTEPARLWLSIGLFSSSPKQNPIDIAAPKLISEMCLSFPLF